MKPTKLPNADGSVLTISTTAVSLESAIRTASSVATYSIANLNACDISVEAEDIRILYDKNTPTATKGIAIGANFPVKAYSLRNVPLEDVKLIRAGSADATVDIQVGYTE